MTRTLAIAVLCLLLVAPPASAVQLLTPAPAATLTTSRPVFSWQPASANEECDTVRRSRYRDVDALGRLYRTPVHHYASGNRFQPFESYELVAAGRWYWQVQCINWNTANEYASSVRGFSVATSWPMLRTSVSGGCAIIGRVSFRTNIQQVRWSMRFYYRGNLVATRSGVRAPGVLVSDSLTQYKYTSSGFGCYPNGRSVRITTTLVGTRGEGSRTVTAYGVS